MSAYGSVGLNSVRNSIGLLQEIEKRENKKCAFLQNCVQNLFRRCYYLYHSRYAVHIHTWRVESYEVRLFHRKQQLSFKIVQKENQIGRGLIPSNKVQNIQQRIDHLRRCDVIIRVQGMNDYYPVFVSEPIHKWIYNDKEVKLLQAENQLVAQVYDKNLGYFQNDIDIKRGCTINDLLNRFQVILYNNIRVNFLEICHTWNYSSYEKEPYIISLLRDGNSLMWHLFNATLRTSSHQNFKVQPRNLSSIFASIINDDSTEDYFNFNCRPSSNCSPSTEKIITTPRKLEEVVKLIRDFTIIHVDLESIDITMEPISRRSEIEDRYFINKFSYAVAMISGPLGIDGNHAKILVEGIRDDDDLEPDQPHNVEIGDHFLYEADLLDTDIIQTAYTKNPSWMKPPISSYEQRTEVWIISSNKVKEMIADIRLQKKSNIPFALFGHEEQNCTNWAIRNLRILGIKVQRTSITERSLLTSLIRLVAVGAKQYTYPRKHFLSEHFIKSQWAMQLL